MRSKTRNIRRATQDLDIDFVRYALADDSIVYFIQLLMRNFKLRVERTWMTLKYEWVFLRDFHEFDELEQSLNEFVYYFESKRIHQSLDYHAP